MKKIAWLAMMAMLVATGISFAQEEGAGSPREKQETAEKRTFIATVDPDGVQRVTVVGGSYFFDPYRIVVKVNVPVELSVTKKGLIPHDIKMDAPEAGMSFKEGIGKKPKLIKFTPSKTGMYPFYCTKKPPFLKSHKDRGMEGVMEVVE